VFESVLLVEASFTAGVAPGIDDIVAPVDAVVGDEGIVGTVLVGTSGSLGKLSVYNILAELLHRINRCKIKMSIREKNYYLFSTP
jgi:hypothetical protein